MLDNNLYTEEQIQKICLEVAAQSPCKKRKVGAVLALKIFADGAKYSISSKGFNHDPEELDGDCECEEGKTKPSVMHAEVHAIAQAIPISDGLQYTMFVTHQPCLNCMTALADKNIGDVRVVKDFMKFDSAKPRMNLVPASLNLACARALTYGAKKYKVGNWKKTDNIETYINALIRHLDAWREGEDNDVESKLHHLDHIAANVSFLIELKDLPKIQDK